ncbi:MAG: ABC-2 type transport system ATP-binding protein [Myxococcota bacterium]|jgi:ABC-2 type transport system ATP-binding protein
MSASAGSPVLTTNTDSHDIVLTIDGLTHSYGSHQVLDGLDLSLDRGEQLGLLGPNGSGKSTAFAIVAGLLPLTGGQIEFEGQPIGDGRAFRARLGVVFQSPSLDPSLSCQQNLELAASLQGIRGELARTRVRSQLELAGLSDRAASQVKTLSGGMRRRLDIGRALLHEPALILMDEPTSGLDEAAFRATWDRLAAVRRERELSILVTTHRPEEAERCDRIAILHHGKVVASGTPAALKAQVASDVVVLTGPDPEALATVVRERFSLPVLVDSHRQSIRVEAEQGHTLIPRLVEAFDEGRLTSVELRRPTLADVFLKVTGAALDAEVQHG